jgi:hypothetical protein
LPGTGWSVEHGDLRVPHFLGLHALQLLPALAWLLWRRRIDDGRRSRLIIVAGGSYASLVLITMWQALRGQSLVGPDAPTLVVFALWAVVTVAAVVWPFRSRHLASDATLKWINP